LYVLFSSFLNYIKLVRHDNKGWICHQYGCFFYGLFLVFCSGFFHRVSFNNVQKGVYVLGVIWLWSSVLLLAVLCVPCALIWLVIVVRSLLVSVKIVTDSIH
jgi:hypothetical protein